MQPHLYALEHLWWSDYTGDSVARSNHRSLQRDFPDTFVELRDALGHQGLALLPSCLTNRRLTSMLLGLGEYPLYDEHDHAALVVELADEAWDAYLCRDVTAMLVQGHGIDCEALGVADQCLRGLS